MQLEAQLEAAAGDAHEARAALAAAQEPAEAAAARAAAAEEAAAEAAAALSSAHGKCAEIGRSQEEMDAQHRDMERAVAAASAQLGVQDAEVSRLMAALAEAQDRAARAEQVRTYLSSHLPCPLYSPICSPYIAPI